MAEIRFTPRAEQDLALIWKSIASDNQTAADRLLIRIFDKTELASIQTEMGAPRPELSPTARILIEGNYIIIYEPAEYGILIVAVVYGGRNPERWLDRGD